MGSTSAFRFPDGIESEPLFPYGERPLYEYLERYADDQPEKTAINYYGRRISYEEFDAAADAFAAALADRGYEPGDTVLVYLHNVPQFSIALVGAQRLGVVPATPMPDGDEDRLNHYIEHTGATAIVAHDTYAPTIEHVHDQTALEDVFYVRYETYLPETPELPVSDQVQSALDTARVESADSTCYLDDITEAGDTPPSVDVSLDDHSLFMFTGGTTGMPKTVPFTHRDNLEWSACIGTVWEFDDHDTHVLAYHVQRSLLFFSVLPQLVFGNTLVLLEQPDDETVMDAVDTFGGEIAMFRSPLVKRILNHPDRDAYDMTSLERLACLSFQTQLTEEMADRWRDVTGSPIYEYAWGSVEMHGVTTFGNRIPVYEPGFVGMPLPQADVAIRDLDTDEELPLGDVGEITVNHPALCEEYYQNPEKTAEAFRDGYFYTSDIGRLTEDGHLYYLGRRREMIRISGEHVAPRDVEQRVETHPAVDSAGVVGLEREEQTELVCAVVLEQTISEDELHEWITNNVDEPHLRPETITIVEEFPVSNVGKLDRDALEEQMA